jgi:hypothetical protein
LQRAHSAGVFACTVFCDPRLTTSEPRSCSQCPASCAAAASGLRAGSADDDEVEATGAAGGGVATLTTGALARSAGGGLPG